MDKRRIAADQIKEALNEALRRREECAGFEVTKILRVSDGPSNWDAEIVSKSTETVDPECKRVMLTVKLGIQNLFEVVDV